MSPRPTSALPIDVQDLEDAVERLARFVLSAAALAERLVVGAADGTPDTEGRERLGRLQSAVDLGQRAIQAAVQHALADRRRGDRRSATAEDDRLTRSG